MTLAYSYIRFSSAEQARGGSLRRQTERRDAWLQKKGVQLDTSFAIDHDLGVSAYHGANLRKDSPLGQFLDAVQRGRVARGSYLILENLDRLSRENPKKALSLFLDIINAGVVVVTLEPEPREFGADASEFEVMMALMEFSRAHGESARKAELSRANWGRRRAQPGVFTARAPNWIDVKGEKGPKLAPEKREFVLNPERAKLVRRIFRMCLEGMGSKGIANKLAEEKVPHITKQKRGGSLQWSESSVLKILRNRACIGEYQPQVKVRRSDRGDPNQTRVVRELHGQVKKNYYPAVVDEATFFEVQRTLNVRRRAGTGRAHSDGSVNLFTGIVRDRDGVVYNYRLRNGHNYLVCKSPRIRGELMSSLAYESFEWVMLDWLSELRLEPGDGVSAADGLRAKVQDLEERIGEMTDQIREKGLKSLYGVLGELETELEAAKKELEDADAPRADQLQGAKELIRELREKGNSDRLRRRLRQRVRTLIRGVVVDHIHGKPRDPNKMVFLAVEFADGRKRLVYYRTNKNGLVGGGFADPALGDRWSEEDYGPLCEPEDDSESVLEAVF